MTTTKQVGAIFGQALRARGFAGGHRRWRMSSDDVIRVVTLDEVRHGRPDLEVGLKFAHYASGEPLFAAESDIVVHLENLPLAISVERWMVIQALDLTEDLDDEERVERLREVAEALADYLSKSSTFDAVRAAYDRGDFKSAFIHKEARRMLEDIDKGQ